MDILAICQKIRIDKCDQLYLVFLIIALVRVIIIVLLLLISITSGVARKLEKDTAVLWDLETCRHTDETWVTLADFQSSHNKHENRAKRDLRRQICSTPRIKN